MCLNYCFWICKYLASLPCICSIWNYFVMSPQLVFSFLPNRTSLVVQTVELLPAIRETRVQTLGREDLLEKEMATHSSTLAWKIPWLEQPGRLQSIRCRVGNDWATSLSLSFLPNFLLLPPPPPLSIWITNLCWFC